jgi:hypothetical protein
MGDVGKTLASFDADTQQKATDAYAKFLGIYQLPGSMVHPDELAAAVQAGLDAAGGDASAAAFEAKLFEELLHAVYQRMAESFSAGGGIPMAINPTLRRSLIQKYGPLPEPDPEGEDARTYLVKVAMRSFEVTVPEELYGDLVQGIIFETAAEHVTKIVETTRDDCESVNSVQLRQILEEAVSVQVDGPIAKR